MESCFADCRRWRSITVSQNLFTLSTFIYTDTLLLLFVIDSSSRCWSVFVLFIGGRPESQLDKQH